MNEKIFVGTYFPYLILINILVLFVCFIALRHKLTAMVMAGKSVHLTTLFPGQSCHNFLHMLWLVTDNNPS